MNTTNATDERIIIPTVTEEGFDQFMGATLERPIPEDLLREARKLNRDPVRFEDVESIVFEDGSATSWLADVSRGVMFLRSPAPCSVANCEGHSAIDLDNDSTWATLSHEVATLEIPGLSQRDRGSFSIILREGQNVLSYYLALEGELPSSDIGLLESNLRNAADRLAEFAR
ncbi:MAG TPA: hypothetical protein PK781_03340 [Terrimesophilobacter sp.]|nr:hypothetical protein [Terrimesophilobacter sp.]HRP99476.1 hypothetical protein [Terrimesophilobacter sp.]